MTKTLENKIKGNFSIITDFGCPFTCGFCITGSQNTKKSFSFTEDTFFNISKALKMAPYTRISISGGGEPLFVHNDEIKAFYERLFTFTDLDIHVHTNLMSPNSIAHRFSKVTISINENNFIKKFQNWKEIKNKRFVHVSTAEDLSVIRTMINMLEPGAELTIKQMDGFDNDLYIDIKKYINQFKNVMFLGEGDYNTYYVLNENKVYDKFKDISFEK